MEEVIVMENLVGKLNNPVIKKYPELENLTITPTKEQQQFTSEKYGYDTVIVEPYVVETEDIIITPYDRVQQFTSDKDGYKNITVKAVETDVEYPELENVTITPTKEEQVFKSEKYGYYEVTVEGYVPDTEDIMITATTEEQTFTSDKDGYKNITVKAVDGETLTVTATEEVQIFEGLYDNVIVDKLVLDSLHVTPSDKEQKFTGKYNNVVVDRMTGETLNITPTIEEQKYSGIYQTVNVEGIKLQEKTVTPTTEKQEVSADDGYNGLSKVIVNAIEGGSSEGSCSGLFTRLEYLESDGNQYIDTGVQAISTIGAELTVSCDNTTDMGGYFGAWNGNGIMFGQVPVGWDDYTYPTYAIVSSGLWNNVAIACDTNWHTFVYEPINKSSSIDGISVNVPDNNGFNANIYLFRGNNYQDIPSNLRISSNKIYNNGTLVRNYIPVRYNETGELGMFDLVNAVFYKNAGTGKFIAGPEI